MNERDRTPDPLQTPRYGTAITAAYGMFDTAGWTPPAAGEYANFDVRRDYGPRGCVGIVYGAIVALAIVATVLIGVL